jgi:hypothetical protein
VVEEFAEETLGAMAAASDAWIACDECEKWRRLPAALAEALGDSEWCA